MSAEEENRRLAEYLLQDSTWLSVEECGGGFLDDSTLTVLVVNHTVYSNLVMISVYTVSVTVFCI